MSFSEKIVTKYKNTSNKYNQKYSAIYFASSQSTNNNNNNDRLMAFDPGQPG